MSLCSNCGANNRSGAAYCRFCGRPLTSRHVSAPPPPVGGVWLSIEQVMAHKPRQWSLLGAFLTLVGSFAPWTSGAMSILGVGMGSMLSDAPQAMLLALLALTAGVLVFLATGGRALMVIGGVVLAIVVMFGLQAMNATPAIGLLLTAVGGGGIMYGGYRTRT